jgi:hypothetical protein
MERSELSPRPAMKSTTICLGSKSTTGFHLAYGRFNVDIALLLSTEADVVRRSRSVWLKIFVTMA